MVEKNRNITTYNNSSYVFTSLLMLQSAISGTFVTFFLSKHFFSKKPLGTRYSGVNKKQRISIFICKYFSAHVAQMFG